MPSIPLYIAHNQQPQPQPQPISAVALQLRVAPNRLHLAPVSYDLYHPGDGMLCALVNNMTTKHSGHEMIKAYRTTKKGVRVLYYSGARYQFVPWGERDDIETCSCGEEYSPERYGAVALCDDCIARCKLEAKTDTVLGKLEHISDAVAWCAEGLNTDDGPRTLAHLASIAGSLQSILETLEMAVPAQHAFMTCCAIHETNNKEGS